MVGEGIVVRTAGQTAVVKIRKSSACGQDCGHCRACDNPVYEVEAVNCAGAAAGDRVLLELPSKTVLGTAFLLYLLPVLLLFLALLALPGLWLKLAGVALLLAIWLLALRYWNGTHPMKHRIVEVLH